MSPRVSLIALVVLLFSACNLREVDTQIQPFTWLNFPNGKARIEMHSNKALLQWNDEVSVFQQVVAVNGKRVQSAVSTQTLRIGEQEQLLPGLNALLKQCHRGEKLRVWYAFPKDYHSEMGAVITFDLVVE